MLNQFSRSELLMGKAGVKQLKQKKIAVFGIGGVGGFVVEALARSGVGAFCLIDHDTISLTNLNRQIIATMQTVGKYKTDVMKERILSINPQADVAVKTEFFLADSDTAFLNDCDYIVDAIDTISAKLALVQTAHEKKFPIISSMGTGNKLDPTQFEIADIYRTSVCPLCRVMRRELKKRDIPKLKVVFSKEVPVKREEDAEVEQDSSKRQTPGSVSFVPPVAGLILASEVIKDLSGQYWPKNQ